MKINYTLKLQANTIASRIRYSNLSRSSTLNILKYLKTTEHIQDKWYIFGTVLRIDQLLKSRNIWRPLNAYKTNDTNSAPKYLQLIFLRLSAITGTIPRNFTVNHGVSRNILSRVNIYKTNDTGFALKHSPLIFSSLSATTRSLVLAFQKSLMENAFFRKNFLVMQFFPCTWSFSVKVEYLWIDESAFALILLILSIDSHEHL